MLRLGFVPLIHAAPLWVAQAHGFFRQHGLQVRLSREVGWATVREKLLGGELDAAQTLGPMPLAMALGLGSVRGDCVSSLILNLHGNVVVIARRHWPGPDVPPAEVVRGLASKAQEPLVFGIVYPHSAQADLLRHWLRNAGLVPDRNYRLVVVPPQQMVAHLRAGHLDAFCAGEPWGSLAVRAGCGVIAELSADLDPGHPEKVLVARAAFAERRAPEHLALIAALLQACRWCADPAHREALVDLLAARQHLSLPAEVIRPSITGAFDLGLGRALHHPAPVIFHGGDANDPTPRQAERIARQLGVPVPPETLARVFRSDLYHAALASDSHPHALAHPSHDALPVSRSLDACPT